jgi:hypothetical protein
VSALESCSPPSVTTPRRATAWRIKRTWP